MRTFVFVLTLLVGTRLAAAPPNEPKSVGIQINVDHSVTLTWKAPNNPSTFQLGYHLFRLATTSCSGNTDLGTVYKSPISERWDDFPVTSGTTYCYAVTAVYLGCTPSATQQCESPKTAPVSARIP